MTLRFAHLSDPHFAAITYSPLQFFSKRWLGNTNLILFRHKIFQTAHLWDLPNLLKSQNVDFLCLTGDFATTSLDQEFSQAAHWVESFKQEELPVFYLPGNHDCYTKKSERSRSFYHFFPEENLFHNRVCVRKLRPHWWWVGLDTAIATSVVSSHGAFSSQMERHLEKLLSEIPKEDHIILGNHFPLFSTGRKRHDLHRAEKLRAILQNYPQVKLYLHGHDHLPYIIDRQKEGYPLVLNSGSCAHVPNGTFYLLDVEEESCFVQRFTWTGKDWVVDRQERFAFS